MPFVKVYIHFVWSTKHRYRFLSTHNMQDLVWKHIRENALKKDIHIDFINGYSDHCHCLVSLGTGQRIQDIMQLIKGESAHWINQQGFCNEKFKWQNDYFAASVSESILNKTREYIKRQKIHHAAKPYRDELNDFLEIHGFERIQDDCLG